MEESQKQKHSNLALKIILIVLASLIALVLLLIGGINIFVHVAFSDFYEEANEEFSIPGLNEGFIPQDIDNFVFQDISSNDNSAENDESATSQQDDQSGQEFWLFSGYMSDGSASPIYKRNAAGEDSKFYVRMLNGETYTGHGSAITSDKFVYLTCELGYVVLDPSVVANAEDGETIPAKAQVQLDFSPAFMNIEHDRNGKANLLLGNFYYPGDYETPELHHIATKDGTYNNAVMFMFPEQEDALYQFGAYPDRVFSIPEKVQGVTYSDTGLLTFSCSYGLSASHLLIYDTSKLYQEGSLNVDDVDIPLFILDSRSRVESLELPPMSEGIEVYNDRLYISFESASNKYIFGKLYGAGAVFSIPQISVMYQA